MEDIKKDEVVTQEVADNSVAQQYARSSVISIPEYFKKINPKDESFYKYIPKDFLNDENTDVRYSKSKGNIDFEAVEGGVKVSIPNPITENADRRRAAEQEEYFKDYKVCDVETRNRPLSPLSPTDEKILYLNENKKRTQQWFQACGIQVPLGETKFGFIRSISQNNKKSNIFDKK